MTSMYSLGPFSPRAVFIKKMARLQPILGIYILSLLNVSFIHGEAMIGNTFLIVLQASVHFT